MSVSQDRDSGWVRFQKTNASLSDYLSDAADGWAIAFRLSFGTFYATRDDDAELRTRLDGAGGGFVWERTMSRKRAYSILSKAIKADTQARHGPKGDVWPSNGGGNYGGQR